MIPTTELPRVPMRASQRSRVDSLLKQAVDGLNILSEERLNLDTDSRRALDEARQAVATCNFLISQQPTIPDRLTASQANAFPKGRWQ